jgi:hypothetical protein
MASEEYWPLHKRVSELLHTLVTIHRTTPFQPSPEFHTYKGKSDHFDWLEHPGIARYRHRLPMQMEDVGILRSRNMVSLIQNRRDDKTFDLTLAAFAFHDAHCAHEGG